MSTSNILGTNPCHFQNGHDDGVRPTDDILAVSGHAVVTVSGDRPRSTTGTAIATGDATTTANSDTTRNTHVHEVAIQDQPPQRLPHCCNKFSSHRRTTTLIVLLGVVIVSTTSALAVYYTHRQASTNRNSNANGDSSISTDASGANQSVATGNDHDSDEASQYLRELRSQILDIDTFRLDPEAEQILATEWMTYVDTPRMSLNQTTRLKQRYALLVIHFAMGGKDWKFYGWANNPGVNECEWDRVRCNTRGDVEKLQLGMQDVDVTGTLVGEIGLLSSLGEFFLWSKCAFSETFPVATCTCQPNTHQPFYIFICQSVLLDFSRNRIEGSIPNTLYSLTKLTFLDLSNNELVGSVDAAIGKLTNLGTFAS
jgi:hypothetical protein